jgi:rod shape-determining protein MreD
MFLRRVIVLCATQLVLWTIVSQLNHALTGWRVYLFVGSLYLTLAALTQPMASGVASVAFGGLLCDTAAPAALFGSHTLLFLGAFFVIHNLRDRVPRDDTTGRIVIALLANFAIFLVFSFLQVARSPAPASMWPRLLMDLLCSQVFLALVAPWFFALQGRTLVLAQVERETFV